MKKRAFAHPYHQYVQWIGLVLLGLLLSHCSPRGSIRPDTSGTVQDGSTTLPDHATEQGPQPLEPGSTPDHSENTDNSGLSDSKQVTDNHSGNPDDTGSTQETAAPDLHSPPDQSTPPDNPTIPDPGTAPDQPQGSTVFYLYDDDKNQFLAALPKNLDLRQYNSSKILNIALKTDSRVKSVRFTFDRLPARKENAAVWTVFSAGTDHRDKLTLGSHTVGAIAYSGTNLTGQVIARVSLTFTVTHVDNGGNNGNNGNNLPKDPNIIPPDPTFKSTKNITKTIVITKSGTYDFKNVLHIWKGKGSCNQTENQPHILRIQASNVTVKNFAYRNAPDGIHIATCGSGQGNTCSGKISNITLDNVVGWACEDVLTTGRGTSRITIKNSMFLGNPNTNYRDKCIQVNFGDDLTITHTIFKNCKRPIRFKSGSQIKLIGNRFYTFQHAVKGDTYKDISNIIPNRQANVTAEKNHFQDGNYAYYMEGKIKVTSTNDVFRQVKNTRYTKDGASISIK